MLYGHRVTIDGHPALAIPNLGFLQSAADFICRHVLLVNMCNLTVLFTFRLGLTTNSARSGFGRMSAWRRAGRFGV